MISKKYLFPKSNRLCSKILIDKLFNSTAVLKCYPLLCSWLAEETLLNHQILIVVPKRLFKKAVDRNRIKRQLREIWRLNQEKILINHKLLISYRQISKDKQTYLSLEKAILKSIRTINESA